jgi:5-bromo-4-chloroindolyl phosphate hydrolysis protein
MRRRTDQTSVQFFRSGLLLFLLPLPILNAILFYLFRGDGLHLILYAGSYALFLAGALLNRRGLHNEAEYQQRRIARAPRLPLKALGAGTVAMATALTAFANNYGTLIAACFGAGAALGCRFVYGPDPRAHKRVVDTQGLDSTDQVVDALENAERNIATIEQANRDIRNPELTARLRHIVEQGRRILLLIEENPRDLRRARKFLNVYLEGAQRVAEGYARTHQRSPSVELEENFRRVLSTIEDVFREQHQKLLEHDVMDLDVQIEVLATQLKREGVV